MAGVKEVFAREITQDAYTLLSASGINLTNDEFVEPDHKASPTEIALQNISEEFIEPTAFFEEMKDRLLKALEHNIFPTDDILLSNLQSRLGVGGGGT